MVDVSFFCSPIGLGHATRDIAIAENFVDISTSFVTGLGAATMLSEYGFHVENVYHPPNFIVKDGSLDKPLRWLWSYYKYYRECKNISSQFIEKDSPKMVISDEDFASLSISQASKIPSILITDILETRFTKGIVSLIEKKMNRSMKKIIEKCDVVILPENGKDEGNIRRVGPIVRQIKFPREELREKFSFNKKTIVISTGGTDAGEFLIKKTLDVFPKLNDDVEIVIVSGPSLKKKFGDDIRNFGFVNNLHEIIFASDLVISLAGKSTIDETNAYGTPGIFIPIKGHFEQEDNAKDEGFIFEDIFRLEDLIQEKLVQKRRPIQSDGTKKAFMIIEQILNDL